MTLTPTSPFLGEGPDFNREAAESVYGQLMKMDAESAEVYGRMIVSATVQYDLFTHADEIGTEVAKMLGERHDVLRKQLARTSIAKARAGEDNSEELEALVELAKANPFNSFFSPSAKSQRAKEQDRDTAGRFEVMHERIDTDPNADVIAGRFAHKLGVPAVEITHNLTGDQLAHFQQAYLQVERMLRPYADMPAGTAVATFRYNDDKGPTYFTIPKGGKVPVMGKYQEEVVDANGVKTTKDVEVDRGIDPTRRVASVEVHVIPKTSAAGGLFRMFNALGMPKAGAVASRASEDRGEQSGALNARGLKDFDAQWNTKEESDQFSPSQRVFRRLDAGSRLLENSLGATAAPQVATALKVARHVGSVGPQAHKILAPTLDRAAYRYRGTERPIDPALLEQAQLGQDEVTSAGVDAPIRAMAGQKRLEAKGHLDRAQRLHDRAVAEIRERHADSTAAFKSGRISAKQYKKLTGMSRKALDQETSRLASARVRHDMHVSESELRAQHGAGLQRDALVNLHRKGVGTADGKRWKPGPVLDYMLDRVPGPELADLQLKSGVVPPSEGIIIGPDGKIKTQTVGYGDDHYLPFKLRNLHGLKGGYYVRTRTFGGPTTEDIYTSLISGARGLTVVSNNGVFSLDFNADLKGGRRFNDKAARMVARYGALLDAVKSGQVPGEDLPADRQRELHQQASKELPGASPAAVADRAKVLIAEERKDPKLSRTAKNEIATDYLNNALGTDKRLSLDAMVKLARESKESSQRRTWALAARDAGVGEVPVNEAALQEGLDKWQSELTENPDRLAEGIATALNQRTGLQQALDDAQAELRRRVQPLQLDGHGYDVALQALKEQFPYYVDDTKYRAIRDGKDSADTGYVKPRFNRPEAALSGSFDPTVGGGPGGRGSNAGKVSADSTRWQNSSVLNRGSGVSNLNRYKVPGAPARAEQTPMDATATTAATTTGPSAAPVNTAALRVAADKAMLDHLLALRTKPFPAEFVAEQASTGTQLGPDATLESVRGVPHDVFKAPSTGLRMGLSTNPEQSRRQMTAAVKWLQETGAQPIDPDVLYAFEHGGAVRPVTTLSRANIREAMADPSREWDFGPAYKRGASRADVEEAYRDEGIQALVDQGLLPATVSADGFTDKAGKLLENLGLEDAAYEDWIAEGRPAPAPLRDPQQIHQHAFLAAKANQLGRRHKEAVAKETEVLEATRALKAEQQPINLERNLTVIVDPNGGEPRQIENQQQGTPGWQASLEEIMAALQRGDSS